MGERLFIEQVVDRMSRAEKFSDEQKHGWHH